MLNTLPSSPKEVARFLPTAYDLRMPVFLWGKPGIGKSDLIRQYAQAHKMDLIDVRLTTLESCDLRGLPRINYETGQTEWMRPEFLPEIDTPVAIFLDELTAAEPRIQASAYQLILDRCIGKHRLAEVHILEDMKAILTPADFLREMPIRSWMNGLTASQRRAVQSFRIPEVEGPQDLKDHNEDQP